jgi:hypothetical protein
MLTAILFRAFASPAAESVSEPQPVAISMVLKAIATPALQEFFLPIFTVSLPIVKLRFLANDCCWR